MQTLSRHDNNEEFVALCRTRLQTVLQRLEWTEEGVLKSFNSNSLASAPAVSKNSNPPAAAKIRTYPESFITNNSIVLSTPKLQSLLNDAKVEAPQNFNDLQANFTRDQKLQIYEYTIENTKKLDNNTVAEVPEGEISLAEIVAEKRREAKRKKRKFRKTKPTRVEEVRALVQLQMQALQQFIENQSGHLENAEDLQNTRQRENVSNQESFHVHYRNEKKSHNKHEHTLKRKETSSVDYKKHQDDERNYERHKRRSSPNPEYSRHRDNKKHKEPTNGYESSRRKRSKSLEHHTYYEERYDKCNERNAKDYVRRRSKSVDSKRDKDYYRRRSKSPSSRNYSKESYQRETHKKRDKARSRSPESQRHKKKRSRSREYRKYKQSRNDDKHRYKRERSRE